MKMRNQHKDLTMMFEHVKCLSDLCLHMCTAAMGYTSCRSGPVDL